jgi:hypothetical protein
VKARLPGLADAEQVAEQSGVEEVQLGRLHHLLSDIGVPRGQTVDDIARFQHGVCRIAFFWPVIICS